VRGMSVNRSESVSFSAAASKLLKSAVIYDFGLPIADFTLPIGNRQLAIENLPASLVAELRVRFTFKAERQQAFREQAPKQKKLC